MSANCAALYSSPFILKVHILVKGVKNEPWRNRCPGPSHGSTVCRCSSKTSEKVPVSQTIPKLPWEPYSGVDIPYPVLADETTTVGANAARFR